MRRLSSTFFYGSILALTWFVGFALQACAADAPSSDAQRKTVLLDHTNADSKETALKGKLLVREILRQALLISARDELGLPTRDFMLRESTPAGTAGAQLIDLQTSNNNGADFHLKIVAGSGDAALTILEKDFTDPNPEQPHYPYSALAAILEEMSRTELVAALKQAGLSGHANPIDAAVKPSEQALNRLTEMNFLSQFTVLREVHELQRTRGESRHTLAALVMAYANLGKLTSFHWCPAHKAFKARSLLYAQRLLHLDKESPFALRHRAYAATLAGLHSTALEDLKTAREKTAEDQTVVALEETPWVPLIEKLCRYDFATIQKEPPPAPWLEFGALIAFMIVEQEFCENLSLVTGRDVLTISPENYYVCDSMDRFHGVSNRHVTTVHGPVTMFKMLPSRLKQIPSLPESIDRLLSAQRGKDLLQNSDPAWAGGAERLATVRGLVSAGAIGKDVVEPSLEALAHIIEEVTFVHIYRRLDFFQHGLGLPVDSYAGQVTLAEAAVADHPYAAVIRCTTLSPARDADKIKAVCADLHFVDAEKTVVPFVTWGWDVLPMSRTWQMAFRHVDDTAEEIVRHAEDNKQAKFASLLEKISPYSPQRIILLLKYDPEGSAEHLKEWEAQFGAHCGVLRELANTYIRTKQYDDAQRCLESYLLLSPDYWGYTQLAEVFWQKDDHEQWKKVLLGSLEQEDFALSHASTRVKLARYHMNRKEWDQAVEYADAAAQTGAAWAMTCAAECHEALKQWNEAEQLIQATALRYSSEQMDWYFWCRRTGHGNVEAAKNVALKRVNELAKNPTQNDLQHIGVFYLLADDKKEAHASFKAEVLARGSFYGCLHLVVLDDELGETTERDDLLSKTSAQEAGLGDKITPGGKSQVALLKWLATACQKPPDAGWDTAALDELLSSADEGVHANLLYFAGRFFYNRKEMDLARKYLTKCTEKGGANLWNRALAQATLRKMPADEEKPASEK